MITQGMNFWNCVNQDGADCAAGEIGGLWVGGDNITPGCWNGHFLSRHAGIATAQRSRRSSNYRLADNANRSGVGVAPRTLACPKSSSVGWPVYYQTTTAASIEWRMTQGAGAGIMNSGIESWDTALVRRQRRAIVFADLVESVRLMQDHEADAIDRWRRFAAQVREHMVLAWGARVVRTAGDGLLIECEAGAGAVGLALALHDSLSDSNKTRPINEAMVLRIGIHVCEVLFDEYEAYGAGVNLSARLATLAQPGGTVVSTEVRDELVDGVHCRISDLGLRYLKHITEPVRAFAVQPATMHAQPLARTLLPAAQDLRPTIAVIPFQSVPADPTHDALGHAMADEIIATLARHPGLRVLSRLTTATVRDANLSIDRLRELLGASFVLSGRFYVRGEQVRLSAELSELREGHVVWTGAHHADIGAIFEGQDELVPQLVHEVARQVLAHELVRVRSLPMESLASYTLFLGASGLINSLVPTDFAHARTVLEHLVDRHPRQATLYAMLSHWHVMVMLQGWSDSLEREREGAWAQAQRAVELDPHLPEALLADSTAQIVHRGDFAAAERSCLLALEISPQHPMGWAQRSETQRATGDPVGALQSALRALALSPLDPQRYVFESFAASAALEALQFDVAQRHARAALRHHVLHAPPHRALICALAMDGQADAAADAAQDALRHLPQMTVGGRITSKPGAASYDSPFARAMLSAGLPR